MPSAKVKQRADIKLVIIEEPEMGLHPNAISVVLLLVLELLWRGYRVCLSTHSPHVLDVVWALRVLAEHGAGANRLLKVFDARKTGPMKTVAEEALKKTTKVHYFTHHGYTKDISDLDPGSTELDEAGWGGLTEFSGRVADVVAATVNGSVDR
jgi:predicted ATP-binding protein involved in virulence